MNLDKVWSWSNKLSFVDQDYVHTGNSVKITYFINQYPKVSHTFIRREILALERQGLSVQRLALRGWSEPTPDPQDRQERGSQYEMIAAWIKRHGKVSAPL